MPYDNSPNKMGHSPAEMGHSPAEMSPFKGHCGPMKMESNKQEKYNLEHDNPVAKHASWMSKFAGNSRMGGPQMKGSPNHKFDRVVLGGNKGDKSKTKPGKKDY